MIHSALIDRNKLIYVSSTIVCGCYALMVKTRNEDGAATLRVPKGEANVNETAVETALRLIAETVGYDVTQEREPSGPYYNLDQSEAFYAYRFNSDDFETLCAQLVVISMTEISDDDAKPEYIWINIHEASPLDEEGEERTSTTQSYATNEWHDRLKVDSRYSTIDMMMFIA